VLGGVRHHPIGGTGPRQARIADSQTGIGAPGEAAGRTQGPLAERLVLGQPTRQGVPF
jgi:hypothetical protein